MTFSHLILAGMCVLLLVVTSVVGLMVDGTDGFMRHVLMGVLASLFACFVHIVVFMYFVVQEKIVTQSILHHQLDASYSARVSGFKSRAVRLSLLGIFSVVITGGLGAAIEVGVPAGVHLIVAFTVVGAHGILFYLQHALLVSYRDVFRAAFGE